MTDVVITDWREGFQKIAMTKLIRRYTGYDLAAGKRCVDDILDRKAVTFALSREQATDFVAEALVLGAVCHARAGGTVLVAPG